jgi:hypothetical protein
MEGFEMNKLSVLGCGVMAGLSLTANPALASGDVKPPRPQLEGAWEVVVTLRVDSPDCANAEIVGIGPNPFPSFNTFHRGGTMSEFGTRSPPASRTSGHGAWKRTGYRSFEYHAAFYSFDASGLLAATMNITADLKVNNQSKALEGVARLVRTDLSGNELRFCATLAGERITL